MTNIFEVATVPGALIRMLLLSLDTYADPVPAPTRILLTPVVSKAPAVLPIKTLAPPVVKDAAAESPNAVLLVPVNALLPAPNPIMVLSLTSVTLSSTVFPVPENDTEAPEFNVELPAFMLSTPPLASAVPKSVGNVPAASPPPISDATSVFVPGSPTIVMPTLSPTKLILPREA